MPKVYSDYIAVVRKALPSTQQFSDIDLKTFVDRAVEFYSQYHPRIRVADIAGDGSYVYPLPNDFQVGFSSIIRLEYPIRAVGYPSFLPLKHVMVYHEPNGDKLRFTSIAPNQVFRIVYTALHQVSDTSSTIPDAHFTGVALLALGITLENLSARYSDALDTTYATEATERTKADIVASKAKVFKEEGMRLLGIGSGSGVGTVWGETEPTIPVFVHEE